MAHKEGLHLQFYVQFWRGRSWNGPAEPCGTFTSLARDFRSEKNNKFMQIPHLVSGKIHTLQPRDRLSFLRWRMTETPALNQGHCPFHSRVPVPAPDASTSPHDSH